MFICGGGGPFGILVRWEIRDNCFDRLISRLLDLCNKGLVICHCYVNMFVTF